MTKEGTGYHGYWPIDLYSLNSKFGTADDLKSLAKEIHGRNMVCDPSRSPFLP